MGWRENLMSLKPLSFTWLWITPATISGRSSKHNNIGSLKYNKISKVCPLYLRNAVSTRITMAHRDTTITINTAPTPTALKILLIIQMLLTIQTKAVHREVREIISWFSMRCCTLQLVSMKCWNFLDVAPLDR